MELVEKVFDWMDKQECLKKEFVLVDQIKRSTISIPSNIAEWFWRWTNKEFIRFLYISLGSCFELKTQLEIAIWLCKLKIDQEVIIKEVVRLIKQIRSLIKYLKNG